MRHSTMCACTLKENDLLDYAVDEKTWYIKKKISKEVRKEGRRKGVLILSMVDCDTIY